MLALGTLYFLLDLIRHRIIRASVNLLNTTYPAITRENN
jgi:hypothetical protein